MNPRIVKLLIKGDNEKQRKNLEFNNLLFYLQGQYFMEAIEATVCNTLTPKSAKKHHYPKKPYELSKDTELTEKEIQKQREKFVAGLIAMKTNFDLNHKGGKGS